MTVFSLQI